MSSSRYSSFDSTSSSTDRLPQPNRKKSSPAAMTLGSSRTVGKTKAQNQQGVNFAAMVKKFMSGSGKDNSKAAPLMKLAIKEEVKKNVFGRKEAKGVNGLLQKKLFGSGEKSQRKALVEVSNARTLGMVLKSERELLGANKELELEVARLKLDLVQKNREVEKLKDLCLGQREEIRSLKNAILFPDVTNRELYDLLDKQGKELKQAKQTIPTLQEQVSSLTDQLQSLADDLAEVKADKYSNSAISSYRNYGNSPGTPVFDHEETINSLEFSSSEATAPGSPGDLFIKDVNPCLTPDYVKIKSKAYEERCWASSGTGSSGSYKSTSTHCHICRDTGGKKLSRSSNCCQKSNAIIKTTRSAGNSAENQYSYRKPMHQRPR
ncbi:hypothetical protein MLD38_039167 [Melastoma candidum]|uniref:Uncharacterized protein n=1 Tax=Melastoma candidum TaxID=119954 RepID=A0ACB9L2A2_9MYRT|nr:hypothetical protein MLD38_039167 [Melastoma candidum]